MKNYVKGWYQVAFEKDVPNGLSPATVGERRLMLVRSGERLRAFSADCPHRGAYLVRGGRLHEDSIICPFHGYQIGLGRVSKDQFSVHEYPVMAFGGMVFVQLSPHNDDEGWSHYAKVLEEGNFLINGFEMKVRTRMETVIENAFDQRHFMAVHSVPTSDFTVRRGEYGELIVESLFYVPTRGSGSAGMEADPALLTPYRAIVTSPGIAMVELQGALAYTVITGATDTADGECIVRLTLALPAVAV